MVFRRKIPDLTIHISYGSTPVRWIFGAVIFVGMMYSCSSEEVSRVEENNPGGTPSVDSQVSANLDTVQAMGGGDATPFGRKDSTHQPDVELEVTSDVGVNTQPDVPVEHDISPVRPTDSSVIVDAALDTTNDDGDGSLTICGNGIHELGEECDPIGGFEGAATCCAPDCRFVKYGAPCGSASKQPTCDPDVCDGAGECVNVATTVDGTFCNDGGGNTCCDGQCTLGHPLPGECDSCVLPPIPKLTIAITESQSINPGHVMDSRWQVVAEELGYVANIYPMSFLDDAAGLAEIDVLIISSPHMELTPQAFTHVHAFLQNGGGLYVQSEFTCNYPGNLLFKTLVNESGGFFKWEKSWSFNFEGTKILGCLASYPEPAPELSYFWSACTVVDWSADTEPIAWYPPFHNLGFAFCAKSGPKRGLLITMSDKDWISKSSAISNAEPLMRNMLARLAFPHLCK